MPHRHFTRTEPPKTDFRAALSALPSFRGAYTVETRADGIHITIPDTIDERLADALGFHLEQLHDFEPDET